MDLLPACYIPVDADVYSRTIINEDLRPKGLVNRVNDCQASTDRYIAVQLELGLTSRRTLKVKQAPRFQEIGSILIRTARLRYRSTARFYISVSAGTDIQYRYKYNYPITA